MKVKKLCVVFAAIAIACSQAVLSVFATEETPKGDWIDTTGMTPVYEVENQSLAAQNYLETDEEYGDFIVDFEVSINGRYLIRRATDGKNMNWADIRMAWSTEARDDSTTQGTGRHVQQTVNGNGWFNFADADADYPTYTEGRNIAFRYQVKNGTMSLWAADLGTEAEPVETPVYKYAGYYTHANAKNKLGTVQLYCMNAQTVKSFRVYKIGGTAEFAATNTKTGTLKLSEIPHSELSQNAIALTDSFGKKLTSSNVAKISDTEYSIEFSENIESGVNYIVEVNATTALGGGYVIENINYLAPSMDVDFNDETWSDKVQVYASGNINNSSTKALVKNNQLELQETYYVITNDTFKSNSVIEFDGMITSSNTGAEGSAKLQINTSANNYSTDSSERDYNSVWIFNHETGKKPQWFLREGGKWKAANQTFSSEAVVKKGTMYSFRLVTLGKTVSLYMKEANGSNDYAFVADITHSDLKTNSGRIEWCANNTGAVNGAIYDNIRVYETDSAAKASINGNVVTVEYSAEPASVLTAADFEVTDGENNAVSVLAVERAGAKTYKLTLATPDNSAAYTVASSATNIYGANLEDATVQALGYTLVTGAESSTAVFTNTNSAYDAAVIFAVYTDGVLDSVEIKNISDIGEDNTLALSGVKENQTCSLFVWDSASAMKALVK